MTHLMTSYLKIYVSLEILGIKSHVYIHMHPIQFHLGEEYTIFNNFTSTWHFTSFVHGTPWEVYTREGNAYSLWNTTLGKRTWNTVFALLTPTGMRNEVGDCGGRHSIHQDSENCWCQPLKLCPQLGTITYGSFCGLGDSGVSPCVYFSSLCLSCVLLFSYSGLFLFYLFFFHF